MPTTPNPHNPDPTPAGQHPAPPGRPNGPSADRNREALRLFLILMLALVVVTQLPLPFRLAGLLIGVGAGWVGIRLLMGMAAMSRAGTPVRGWPSVIIGLGLTTVLMLVLAVQAVFYPVVAERERCLSGANTLKAEEGCDKTYQDRLDRLTDDVRRRVGASPS